jgi:hypothetical protein
MALGYATHTAASRFRPVISPPEPDTSVSALVVAFLRQLSGRMEEFARLEALQREIQAEIGQFRAADRLGRDEVHDRAVR